MTSYFATALAAAHLRLVLLFCLLCAGGNEIMAAEPTRDIRIVVDISGSMKKNDPHLLRQPAVRLLADLLPKGTQAGVWTFGKYVNMLVPLKPVTDEWRSMAKARAADINSIAAFTNIGEAIETASAGWQHPNPKSDRHLILLTDGWVDISNNASDNHQARQHIIKQLLPTLKNNGVKFHTLALANEVDKELLQLLAAESQGSYLEADHADDLLKVFVSALDQSVKPQQVPIEADGFNIDNGIEEFTALIFKKTTPNKPVSLITPDGKTLSAKQKDLNLKWLTDAKFDLITIAAPKAGQWQLIADLDPSSRVTILSDLSLQVKGLPAIAEVGSAPALEIMLTEKGSTITRAEFLKLLTVTVKQQQGDHLHKTILSNAADPSKPNDGIYRLQLADNLTAGAHQFTVEVDGQTFKRVYKQTLQMTAIAKTSPSSPPATPLPSQQPSQQPLTTLVATPTSANEIAVVATEIENSDHFAEPVSDEPISDEAAADTGEDDFFEDPVLDDTSELDEAAPADSVDNTPPIKPAAHPPSQPAWFKWTVAGCIFLANLLLFSLGTWWYRRASKRRLAEERLEDHQLEEDDIAGEDEDKQDEDNQLEEPAEKPARRKAKTQLTPTSATVIEDTSATLEDGPTAALAPEMSARETEEILEDPLKDLHADEFDHDLDMPPPPPA